MDDESKPESPTPNNSPMAAETPPAGFRVQRGHEHRSASQLSTLERLVEENCVLQRRILLYRKYAWLVADVLDACYGVLLRMQNALEKYAEGEAAEQAGGKAGGRGDGRSGWI